MAKSKNGNGGARGALRRAFAALRPAQKSHKYHYEKLNDRFTGKHKPTPWQDILRIADLREGDAILDMGCAEGHITMEVARQVSRAHGVEVDPARVEEATRIAADKGIRNVTFAAGNVSEYPLEPASYDLCFFLGVLGKGNGERVVDLSDLERLLHATRRQIYIRVGIQKQSMVERGISLPTITAKMDALGFDTICFARQDTDFGNIIVGSRRGAGARLKRVPPMMLVATESMMDHPCLKGAEIAKYNEFT